MNLIVNFLTVLITNYALFVYQNTKYELNCKKLYARIYILFSSFVISIINLLNFPFVNLMCYFFFLFILNYFCFNLDSTIKYLIDEFIIVFIAILDAGTHFFVEILLEYFVVFSNKEVFYIKSYLCLLIIVIFCLILKNVNQGRKGDYINFKENMMHFIFPIVSIILLLLLGNIVTHEKSSFLLWQCFWLATILIILNLIILDNLFSIDNAQRIKILYTEEKKKNQLQERYYIDIKSKYDLTREVIHDFKNHINMIKLMKYGDDNVLLDKYIYDMKEKLYSSELFIDSGYKVIDMVVTDKMKLAKSKGIKFNSIISDNFKEDDLLFISEYDIVTLLTNILDNAIEACEISLNKEINLFFLKENEMIIIKLENSCNSKFKKDENGNIVTSKQNHYGLGLKIVKRTANKYNGFFKIDMLDDICITNIVFPKTN